MVEVINLTEKSSLLSTYIAEMRDVEIQKDPLRFRRNIERIGEIMAYEISKRMEYDRISVTTPLGQAPCSLLADQPVLGTILRAGLPFHQGFLSYFDRALNAFVSAYRKVKENNNFDVHVEYIATPVIDGKTLILVDPMLATGASMDLSYRALLKHGGTPACVHMASIIASQQAVDYITTLIPNDVPCTLWVGAIDPTLNEHAYIVPGLGDAGDLAYGGKKQ